MWRPVVRTAPVAGPLVTFEAAADELRLDAGDEADHQSRVERYIAGAEAHVGQVTGLQLAEQAVELRATEWSDLDALPIAPISAVAGVVYVDADGVVRTLDPAAYAARLEGLSPAIVLAPGLTSWPARRPGTLITIAATAGFGDDMADLPGPIVDAVLLLVRARNDQGAFDAVEATVEALLANYRMFSA